jgi:hypothetical protein
MNRWTCSSLAFYAKISLEQHYWKASLSIGVNYTPIRRERQWGKQNPHGFSKVSRVSLRAEREVSPAEKTRFLDAKSASRNDMAGVSSDLAHALQKPHGFSKVSRVSLRAEREVSPAEKTRFLDAKPASRNDNMDLSSDF